MVCLSTGSKAKESAQAVTCGAAERTWRRSRNVTGWRLVRPWLIWLTWPWLGLFRDPFSDLKVTSTHKHSSFLANDTF